MSTRATDMAPLRGERRAVLSASAPRSTWKTARKDRHAQRPGKVARERAAPLRPLQLRVSWKPWPRASDSTVLRDNRRCATALAGLIGNVLRVVRFRVYGLLCQRHRQAVLSTEQRDPHSSCSPLRCSRSASPRGGRQPGARTRRRVVSAGRAAHRVDCADGRCDAPPRLLPTYNQVGVAAPILLVTMRLVQGFSLGGEFTGSMVYTTELASPLMRGLVSSSTAAGTTIRFHSRIGSRVARQRHAYHQPGGGVGLAHSVRRQRGLLHRGMVSAPRHSRDEEGVKSAAVRGAARAVARRRLAADRPHLRHRRDDQRGLLPSRSPTPSSEGKV